VFLSLTVALGENLSQHFPGRPIADDMNSDIVVSAAHSWFKECRYDHPQCGESEPPLLPTRVLDVTLSSDEDTTKLHISSRGQRAEYLALSYCWGGPQPLVATVENLDIFTEGIRTSHLPQTLRDAVVVTRRLGFRYLWIDALCIVQDSVQDKTYEIQRMGQVYKDASATIIAGASQSATKGFLRTRTPPLESRCKMFVTMPDGVSGNITLSPLTYGAFNFLPLSGRAWGFQEYLLSSRHLYYTGRELVWQCRSLSHRTVTIGSVAYPSVSDRVPFGMFHGRERHNLRYADTNSRKAIWKSILTEYTRRALTDPADKLNAMAGVANELAELWNDEYVFGIWRSRFVEELAWSISGGDGLLDQRLSLAPSWSWASMKPSVQICAGWIDEMSDTALKSLSDDRREASVNGKVLTSVQIPISTDGDLYDKTQSWGYVETDLEEIQVVERAYFLMIGYADNNIYALFLAGIGRGKYARLGLGVFEDPDEEIISMWSHQERQDVILV
jgi:hypothetical protein